MRDISKITKEPILKDWIKEAEKVNCSVFENALQYAIDNVADNIDVFRNSFPTSGGENGKYLPTTNASTLLASDWTSSFWTGMVWLAYELTGDEKFKEVGLIHSKSFRERYENNDILDHHDIGFLYSLSCVAAYKLTGDEFSKETAIKAARKLLKQYMEKCGAFQQWGSTTDANNYKLGVAIIDCCMNLPLLYWAATVTGEMEFFDKAYTHIRTASTYLVRDNGATHQCLQYDVFTGELLKVYTGQGDGRDEGCWSRGQAWAIYGFVLSYLYTGDKTLLEYSKICTNYFLNRLQSDNCANWDFIYRDDNDQRDTSAVTIAACGMLELAKQLPLTDSDRAIYEAASKVLISDVTKNYLYTKQESPNALLKAGVYAFGKDGNKGLCVDEPTIWGDYFYMEALTRLTKIHKIYW